MMANFWQFGDDLRGHIKVSEDHEWLMAASKLAEQTKMKGERINNLDLAKGPSEVRTEKFEFQEDNKYENLKLNKLNLDSKSLDNSIKIPSANGFYNVNPVYPNVNPVQNNITGMIANKHGANINIRSKEPQNTNNHNNTNDSNNAADRRFKTLPATETLPRNEVLGGYIFVCNNDTMQEDLKRQLFGNYCY